MKKTLFSLCATLLVSTSTTVIASDWSIGGNVAFTSDYVHRGMTQSDAEPAIQGGFDLNHTSGFLVGVFGSNVESDPNAFINFDGANMEMDVYLGWESNIADNMKLTAKAMRMIYPGTNISAYDSNEFSLYLDYDFGPAAINSGVNYSDDAAGTGEAWYWDATVNIPAGPTTIGLHVGKSNFDDGDDYIDYSIGIFGEIIGLTLAVTYVGTDDVLGGCVTETCNDRVTFTVSKYF